MTKNDLIAALAEVTDTTKKQAGDFLAAFNSIAADALKANDDVILGDLGKLKPVSRAARTGKNPKTGEVIQIAAVNSAKLAVSKALKDRLN